VEGATRIATTAGPWWSTRPFTYNGQLTHFDRAGQFPGPVQRPRVPLVVGGNGEHSTFRLVARYADACNVFGAPDMLRHKFSVLAQHCADVGRDYNTIERTNLSSVSITEDGKQGSLTPAGLVERLGNWAEAGSHHTIFSVRNVWDLAKLELIGRDVIPQVRALGEPSPLDMR